jgi:hypothetical protein
MKTSNAWIIAVAVLIAACGGSTAEERTSGLGSSPASGAAGAADPAAAWVGTYAGTMTLPYGSVVYTLPVRVAVENPSPGIVRVPIREMCPSVDHVDFAPPEALLIAVAESGAWSFALPTGEHVRLGSVHPRFDADGRSLTITFHGVVDGKDLEWTFVGAR